MRGSSARGNALTIIVATAATAGVLWAGFSTFDERPRALASTSGSGVTGGVPGNAGSTKLPVAKKRRVPTSAELKAALARCGLSPKVLTAAGVSAPATTTLVGNARQYLTDHPDDLATADADLFAARATYDQLLRIVQQGQSTENDQIALGTLQSTLATALAARDTALAAIKTAAVVNLSENQQASITIIRANAAWSLPVQYLATTRAEADWVNLRDAISNDHQAAADTVDPDPDAHQRLLDANAVPVTSSAAQNLANNLLDVSAAFSAAVNGG